MNAYDLARQLPNVSKVRDRCVALAMLDRIIAHESGWHNFDFHPTWSASQEMATMNFGGGDEYSIAFTEGGAFLRGFDHESVMSPYGFDPVRPWPGLFDGVPEVFEDCLNDPNFSDYEVLIATICLWRTADDTVWRHGNVELPNDSSASSDGADLFAPLLGGAAEYRQFALRAYPKDIDLGALEHVLALRPLENDVIAAIDDGLTLSDLTDDIIKIGYPT